MSVVRLRPTDLRDALASNGTSLQFQVQVHLPTTTLAGVEALVRWPHPVLGMVGPQEITQLVDQGALHVEFDEWVLGAACAQMALWQREGVPLPSIGVNVWEPTLRKPDFLRLASAATERAGVGPEMLEIELPRGAALEPEFVAVIGSLRTRGIRIAADVRALEDMPPIEIDTVKLPYPLTSAIAEPGSRAVAESIVAAARARKMRVVAEGVETTEQQQAILATGCEIVQGYVFGPEASAAEVSQLARRAS
jgi:EAL domain-containing protein (putative c-di-GMP-specific phosphodiesterase class I)